ncbi:MAG: hypothetical protein D0433_07515 [Candidatus Thermochlorobacter aerophilum]|uniref:Uncharacterized protein n=1 Tax=Candidatus Thermochlorobacter aerophilus TaxID=1868324 RepID=A0A395M087_9BACT|nr:MAG: hypothetical protein D0433_07515 [Candidatus Thermochlorobacter aerophilum]
MALKDTTFAESLNCWGEDSNLTLLSLPFARRGMPAPADRVRSIQYGCFASLSMTGQRWHSEQFVIPSVSEESSAWMLRFAQHDRMRMANLTLLSLSFNKERDVCASRQGEVNPVWMLRFAQHDRMRMANLTLLSLSFTRRGTSAPADRVRSIQYGCFTSLSMTGQRWHSEQFVIPSVSEESSAWMLHCATLRSA